MVNLDKLVKLRGSFESVAKALLAKFKKKSVTKDLARRCRTLYKIFLTTCGCDFLVKILNAGDFRGPNGSELGREKFEKIW